MKIATKSFIVIAIVSIIFATLYQTRYLFEPGLPTTVDTQYHVTRIAQFHRALESGQIPPRWAPSMNDGFGYPVFNFNYPLANFLLAMPLSLKLDFILSFKLYHVIALFLSGFGMFLWLKKKHQLFALIASITWVLSPFFAVNLYERGSIGEITVGMIFPWLFWSFDQTNRNKYFLIIIFSMLFLLSHNITVLISIPLLISYVLFFHKTELKQFLFASITALLLASWFWIPAMNEINYITVRDSSLNSGIYRGFRTLSELFNFPPHNFNYSIDRTEVLQPVDIQLGYAQFFILLVGIIYVFKDKRSVKKSYWILVSIFYLTMIHPLSKPLWHVIPMFNFVQFPFRLLMIVTFGISISIVYLTKFKWLAIITICLSLINTLFFYHPKYYSFYSQDYLRIHPLTSAATNEFDPRWFIREKAVLLAEISNQPVFSQSTDISLSDYTFDGFSKTFTLDVPKETRIIEKTMYYPGWQTWIDGKPIDLRQYRSDAQGLINYPLNKGTYSVKTAFIQNSLWQRIGNTTSIIGIIILCAYGIHLMRKTNEAT